ncbi:MAG: hypothetical protein Q4A75_04995 [Peptostreptococcaceae bacterium]|nr:hypothetical protein [Peptostreptococcaceae bacterium]
MAFVYRKLTQEERAYIASFKIRSILSTGLAAVPRNASVDEERGMYFFALEGQGYRNGEYDAPPTWCSFIWNGDVFRITIYFTRERKEDGTLHGFYRVVTIYAPEEYEGREEEFIQAIQEAIFEYAKEWGCTSMEFSEMARPLFVDFDISQTGSYA